LQRHASAAKLLVIERVLPERIDPDDPRCRANVLTDVNMMLMSPGGRERTEVEHRQLLMQAGFANRAHRSYAKPAGDHSGDTGASHASHCSGAERQASTANQGRHSVEQLLHD
jgi:O-methyltransferase